MMQFLSRFLIVLVLFVTVMSTQAQVITSWQSTGIGGGGALFSPSINPDDDNEMYIACDMGGLYHTKDKGKNWQLQSFSQIRGGHYSKVNFTSNPLIRYCLNYKSDGIEDIVIPSKSNDGGLTWQKLAGNPDDYEMLYALFANYNNPNQVLINQYNSIYFSSDGGASFSLAYTGMNSSAGCKLSGVFWDGNNIYLACNDGIIRSTNGGASFSLWTTSGIPSNEAITSFAAAKSGNTTRFYALCADASNVYNGDIYDYYAYMANVYTMDNTSGVWINRTWPINTATEFGKFIAVASNDVTVAYIAGQNVSGHPMVFKTSNAGSSWVDVFKTNNNQNIYTAWCGDGGDVQWSWAELFFGLSVSPTNANHVLVSDFGFVHQSADGCSSWHQAYADTNDENTANLLTPTKQNYSSAGDLNQISVWQVYWNSAKDIWSCASDVKGTISADSGKKWSFNYNGHNENTSYRVAKNIVSNTLYMATSSVHDLYQSTRLTDAILDNPSNTGSVKFSTDNGSTWQVMHDFSNIVCWLAVDPNQSNVLYASVVNSDPAIGGIWVTQNAQLNAASTWTKLPNPPRTEGHPYNIIVLNDGKVLVSYSARRAPGFTASSGVFLFDPQNSTWTDCSDAGMQYWTQDVILDPFDVQQNTWYACVYEGWGISAAQGVGGLYKTTNRGLSWTLIWNNERCMSATVSPLNKDEMYVSTEYHGLWYCSNLSSVAPQFVQTNFPFRNTLRTFYNPYNQSEVWVASFGQGMMKGSSQANSTFEVQKKYNIELFPNPVSNVVVVGLPKEVKSEIYYTITDVFGATVKEAYVRPLDNKVTIRLDDFASGMYSMKILGANVSASKVFVKY